MSNSSTSRVTLLEGEYGMFLPIKFHAVLLNASMGDRNLSRFLAMSSFWGTVRLEPSFLMKQQRSIL